MPLVHFSPKPIRQLTTNILLHFGWTLEQPRLWATLAFGPPGHGSLGSAHNPWGMHYVLLLLVQPVIAWTPNVEPDPAYASCGRVAPPLSPVPLNGAGSSQMHLGFSSQMLPPSTWQNCATGVRVCSTFERSQRPQILQIVTNYRPCGPYNIVRNEANRDKIADC